jgi:hypothetical protein
MSSGGQLPQLPQQSDSTGATGGAPTTSPQMQAYSPAGGKGGYPSAQQQPPINPFAAQYQRPRVFEDMNRYYDQTTPKPPTNPAGLAGLMGGLETYQRPPDEAQPMQPPPQILTQYQPYKYRE